MFGKQQLASTIQQISRYMQTGWRRHAITTLFFLLSVAAAVSILLANWDTLKSYEWQLRPIWGISIVSFLAIDLFLGSYAWHLLVTRLTPHNDLRFDIKCWHYANLARRVPGPIWYIASRAVLYEQRQISKTTTSIVSGLELALIILAGVAAFLLTLPFWVLPPAVVAQLNQSWLLIIVLILCFIFIHPRVLNKLWARISEHPPPLLQWREAAIWFSFYIIIWVIGASVLFSVINLLLPLSLVYFIPIVGMWAIANVISVAGTLAFSGIGLREISLTLLLTQFVPLPVALLIAILLRLIWLIGESIGASLSLLL